MIFIVKKASLWSDDSPCEGAVLRDIINYDRWQIPTFERYKALHSEDFTKEGFDHRITPDGIRRSFKIKKWTYEINSLEEMMEFIDRNGEIVIRPQWQYDLPEILIYDDYIE